MATNRVATWPPACVPSEGGLGGRPEPRVLSGWSRDATAPPGRPERVGGLGGARSPPCSNQSLEKSAADGGDGGLGAVGDLELVEHALHVLLGGGDAPAHAARDLAVGQAGGDGLQDVALDGRQRLAGGRGSFQRDTVFAIPDERAH